MALLRYDVDYTLSHWRLPCCDLWEECIGFHYHTRLVQQAALAAGATFLAVQDDPTRAAACAAAAGALLAELDRHFDPEDGVYRGRLTETDAGRELRGAASRHRRHPRDGPRGSTRGTA